MRTTGPPVHVELECPHCHKVIYDPKIKCNCCGHRWYPHRRSGRPRVCPKCGRMDWWDHNAPPVMNKKERDMKRQDVASLEERKKRTVEKELVGIEGSSFNTTTGRVAVQPKQDYYTESICCELCRDRSIYLHKAKVYRNDVIVETFVCGFCRQVLVDLKPNEVSKQWLKLHGVSGKVDWLKRQKDSTSVEELKEFYKGSCDTTLW